MTPHGGTGRRPGWRRPGRTLAALVAALGLCAAPLQAAELGRLDLAAPGAMISSCSGMNWSGSDWTQAFGSPVGTPLPEPGPLGLLMAAAAGLALARRCAGPARGL